MSTLPRLQEHDRLGEEIAAARQRIRAAFWVAQVTAAHWEPAPYPTESVAQGEPR